MYLSKYYTCEEIDQRLLQGYYDDFVKAGFVGTIQEFWTFVLSIKNKVDKVEGYGLSKNDFTDELLAKLNGIEEHANYVTKVSQLENDMAYQNEDQVREMISDLVDGADDALDTLKELAEALGNDPNFATNITNKLTELRGELQAEIERAKNAETDLANQIVQLNSDLINKFKEFLAKLEEALTGLNDKINKLEDKVDEDIAALAEYKTEMANTIANARAEAKAYTDAETNRAKEAEQALAQADHDLMVKHEQDKANLEAAIQNETTAREQADKNLTASLAAEQQARIDEDAAIRQEFAKADQEIRDKYVPWTNVSTTELPNRKAIVLPTYGDVILATGPDGRTFALAQLNRWGVMDFGSGSFPINLNTPAGVRPTAQEAGTSGEDAHELAYKSDVDQWFGKILEIVPEEYLSSATIQVIPALEQSYLDDLGYPDTVNGAAYVQGSSMLKIGDPYLSVAYFDESFTFHYHMFTNSSVYTGQLYWTMIDLARQGKEAHDKIKEEIDGIVTDQGTDKEELLKTIQEEAQARQEADQALDEKKVDKVDGYGLSKNDFTDELLAKLNSIEEGANKIEKLSQLLNDCDFQNSTQVNEAIEKVIGSAPEVLDTLEEIAKALGDDPNFAATITKKLAAITEDLNEESSRAQTAEEVLQANIEKAISQTDTKLSQLNNQFQTKLDTETDARKLGDHNLQTNIDSEAKARQIADQTLTQAISQESSDRQAADQNLQSQITELSKSLGESSTTLVNYVNAIRDSLQKSISSNTDLINTNTGNIQHNLELIQALQKQYNTLDASVTALTTALNQEIEDRKNADKALQESVDTLGIDLNTEISKRQAADNILQANIDKEIQDRKDAIAALEQSQNQALAQEIQDRKDADQAIQDQVDTFPDNIRVNEQSQTGASTFQIIHTYKYKDAQKKYSGESQNIITIPAATSTEAGVMTAEDKNKLEKVIVDLQTETNNRTNQDEILQGNINTLSKQHQDDVERIDNDINTLSDHLDEVEEELNDTKSIPVNFPVYGLKDQVYDRETILGWFGVSDESTLKQMIAYQGLMYLKYGIQLSGNPHYYRMPIQYAAFESATQIKLVALGLDISNDAPVKYEIVMNLNGTIIEGNSNVKMTTTGFTMGSDVEDYNTRITKLESQVVELIAALTRK